MIEKYSIRTDLALEDKERFESDNVEVQGVSLKEDYDEEREIKVTTVKIETENGAKVMRKPVGTYITMEAPNMAVPDEDYHDEISKELAKFLARFIKKDKEDFSILVVGLGNRKVTPDALGPYVVDNLNITRHIVKEYGKYAMGEENVRLVSAIVPGVMAQTGMETVEIIKGIVRETKPDMMIAVDALAARSSKRLNRTIQITDTGINPGSGVGNHRNALTQESLGVPVIAIGIPTVVDAATIVNDALEKLLEEEKSLAGARFKERQKLSFAELNNMYMTGKDIDAVIKRVSFTVSEGINIAIGENLMA